MIELRCCRKQGFGRRQVGIFLVLNILLLSTPHSIDTLPSSELEAGFQPTTVYFGYNQRQMARHLFLLGIQFRLQTAVSMHALSSLTTFPARRNGRAL